mgnify:CR=1 FL=1
MTPEEQVKRIARAAAIAEIDEAELVVRLIEAADQTGVVRWLDKTGTEKRVELGSHLVRIMPRGHG